MNKNCRWSTATEKGSKGIRCMPQKLITTQTANASAQHASSKIQIRFFPQRRPKRERDP